LISTGRAKKRKKEGHNPMTQNKDDAAFEKAAQEYFQSEMEHVQKAYAVLSASDRDHEEWVEEQLDETAPGDVEEDEYDRHVRGMSLPSLQDRQEQIREKAHERPLSIEVIKCCEILLSTGGPANGYFFWLTEYHGEYEPSKGYFWYQDWFKEKRMFWLDNDQLAAVWAVYDIYVSE
jgi:hypothetical protein